MAMGITPAVEEFFHQYARSRSALDIDLIASQYPETFMVAGPDGAKIAEKSAVLAAFPKGQAFLGSLGHQSTAVRSLSETRLDDHYVMVRAAFAWRFQRASLQPTDVIVESTFILHIDRGAPRIVFQHELESFQHLLLSSGVLP